MAHGMDQQLATQSSFPLTPATSAQHGDHERLFRLLEEVGPAPEAFMLSVSDPLLERENIFEDEDES